MIRTLCSLLGIGLLGAAAPLLPDQNAPQPPKMLLIVREDIKEGKGAEHEQSESRFMRAAAAAKFPANILGLNSITGTAQAWFLEAYDSFESIEKSRAAMHNPELASLDGLDAEFRSGSRSSIAVYRPDLSYHGQQLMQTLPKMRYFNVITIRARRISRNSARWRWRRSSSRWKNSRWPLIRLFPARPTAPICFLSHALR